MKIFKAFQLLWLWRDTGWVSVFYRKLTRWLQWHCHDGDRERFREAVSPLLHWLLPHLHYPRYHHHDQHGCHHHHHHLRIKCDQMLCYPACSALITSWIFTKLIVLPNALLGPVCIAISKDYCHALDTAFIYKITLWCIVTIFTPLHKLGPISFGIWWTWIFRRYHWQSKNDLTNLRAE